MITSYISPKTIVRESGSLGLGSFATEIIRKDEVVIIQGGRILHYKELLDTEYRIFREHAFQVEKEYVVAPFFVDKKKMDGVCYVNHSCNPNCGFDGQIVLKALRDIHVGEEITYDYVMTDSNTNAVACYEFACLCGAQNCRGVVSGEDWKRKDLQEKYHGYFSPYLKRMIRENV